MTLYQFAFKIELIEKSGEVTASSQKDRTRTGRSQKIAPGLEASNQVRDVKPGPERSEGPASNTGLYVKREPDRSEGSLHPARFGRAQTRAAKRSAPADVWFR